MTAKPPRLREIDIQRAITDVLELDGWRPLRTDPCSDRSRGKGFGETGMADHLYIRYCYSGEACEASRKIGGQWDIQARVLHSQVMWIEHKRPRGRISDKQRAWHAGERARGALTLIAGEDFEPSLDGFMAWYRSSGLQRKDIRL